MRYPSYEPGDVAVIHPIAASTEVDKFLETLGWKERANQTFEIEHRADGRKRHFAILLLQLVIRSIFPTTFTQDCNSTVLILPLFGLQRYPEANFFSVSAVLRFRRFGEGETR